MVTSLLIQNRSLPTPVLFKGIGYSVEIPGRAVDFTCQIPTENALEDVRVLLNNVPSLEIMVLEDGEGIPIPPPVPDPPVLSYIGNYTPVVLQDENYHGVWDSSSGADPHENPESGWYWRVVVPGSHELDGINEWEKNDFVKWNGALWMKVVGLAGYQSLFDSLSDGNRLFIGWEPEKYTPEKAVGSDTIKQLSSHLKGIDEEFKKIPDVVASYAQSEADISAAVQNSHSHENIELLDTYAQSEADIADAVGKKHAHANSAALDAVSGVNTGNQDLSGYALTEDVSSALAYKAATIHSHTNVTTSAAGFMSAADKSKLNLISPGADVTATSIYGVDEIETPVNTDEFPLIDSQASNALKKITWANIKATLKSYFDALYTLANLGGVPTSRTINAKPLSSNVTLSTADISDSSDARYCTDAQKVVVGNTSGTNTGDQTGGTPAITLGTTNTAGSSPNFLRRDDTILAFDVTAPTTQAFGDAAETGSATVAARRDHKHAMPEAPSVGWAQTVGTFTATPASTSTLTMTTDLTGLIAVGMALKCVIGGVDYYGVVAAIASNLLTVNGAPLSGDVTGLYYGGGTISQVIVSVPGAYEDANNSTLLASDNLTQFVWKKPKSYCVFFSAYSIVHDSGATHGNVNVMINSAAVSTTDTNKGPLIAANGTWYPTAVDINTSNYDINPGEVLEIQATKGSTGDASDLTVAMVFVTP